MSARRKRSHNPEGRPDTGLSEVKVLVPMPALLRAAVARAAKREHVSASEWWRRAARLRLGWIEVIEEPATR